MGLFDVSNDIGLKGPIVVYYLKHLIYVYRKSQKHIFTRSNLRLS